MKKIRVRPRKKIGETPACEEAKLEKKAGGSEFLNEFRELKTRYFKENCGCTSCRIVLKKFEEFLVKELGG